MQQLLWFVLGCGITLLSVPALIPITRRLGLVDIPGGRRCHVSPTPKAGGLALVAAILGVGVVAGTVTGKDLPTGLLAGSLILVLLGLWDDSRPISAIWRLSGQTLAGFCMTRFDHLQLEGFGNLLGTGAIELGMFAEVVTVFAVVGGINCINMLDGMNGLSGSVALIVVAGLLIIVGAGAADIALPGFLLAGSLVGFLCYNHPALRGGRSLVFLGEAGSNLLGFWLAWLLVAAAGQPEASFPPVTAVWLMLVPLADTLCLMLRRALEGRSPFSADREHVHHLLLRRLGSEQAVVWWLSGMSLGGALAAFGTAQSWWSEPLAFYAFLVVLAGHTWRSSRRIMRDRTQRTGLSREA
ncbi:MAG: MraY family glycosyltransferase [Nevskiales bacterium]